MCGICGMFQRDGAPVDPEVLIRMNRTMAHRGPDEEGYFLNSSCPPSDLFARHGAPLRHPAGPAGGNRQVGLGHRRLSIIDLSSGQQPLSNEDGSIWISFNGEIYNFQSLKQELESKGHRFRTNSDTETIVHAYEEWGADSVKRLRGMFAYALWDGGRERLFLARDRLGKKPLYYALESNRLVFASEIKGILEAHGISREIDLTALSDYLSLLYVPSPKTIFRAISKLPAAHYAIVTADFFTMEPYWDLQFFPQHEMSEDQMSEGLLEILNESTQMRRISDVPLGAFLSGGVDSSAVVALMANGSSEPVITNSISFSEARYNEVEYARKVARLFATDHHEFHVTPEAIEVIEQLAWHYDEPFADSSAVPTYYVSQKARENVIVALSGDGGDENFAGYRRYYFDMRENAVRNLVPPGLRQPLFGLLGRLYPKADYLPQIFRGKAFISNIARTPVDAYFFSVSAFDDEQKRLLLRPEIDRNLNDYRTSDLFHEIYDNAPAMDHLSRIQYLDIKTYLCEDILTKVDRASMAVSLEVRCPILDHVFMEYVAKIPWQLKLSGANGKHIFKKALKRCLPEEIIYRKKMGFGVPILEWLRKDLKGYSRDMVLGGDASREFLDPGRLLKLWNEHQSGIRNRSTELWAVMMLNLWYKNFARQGLPASGRPAV